MKTFLIMRFGIPHPTQEETRLVFRIAANSRPEGGPFPGASPTAMSGVMSIIKSNLTAQQIADEFQKMSVGMSNDTGKQQGSIYPVIVHEINPDNFAWSQDMAECNEWGECFERNLDLVEPARDLARFTLDDMLDLIKERGGLDNLTQAEHSRLQELSQ